MCVFVDFEAGLFEIRALVYKSAILGAGQEMSRYGHVDATSVDESAAGLLTQRSRSWREEHRAPSPEDEWRDHLDRRHLERRKFHNNGASQGVGVRRYERSSAAHLKGLMIPEIIVVALNCYPILQIESIAGHDAARIAGFIRDPITRGLLLEKPGPLHRHLISGFLGQGCN